MLRFTQLQNLGLQKGRITVCMRLLVACGEVEHSKETGQCVRRIGSPRCGVCVGYEAGWCLMNVAVWVEHDVVKGPVYTLVLCFELIDALEGGS